MNKIIAFLKDIVHCYVESIIDDRKNASEYLEKKFNDAGWKENIKQNKKIYTKGSKLKFTFDYVGDKLEIQIILEKISDSKLKIKVGNWGFPFEPLLAKKRYREVHDGLIQELKEKKLIYVRKV
ncbi:hypothetical protein ACFLYT_00210 [Nanoarchaeota archaeon]